MEIPKSKILIYVLTFLAYSYSGYGSTILTQLKDAVLSAEVFFGDVLTKFLDVVQKVKIAQDALDSSLEEECVWSCPGGVKAVRNKYYKVKSNGCGPSGMEEMASQLEYDGMNICCNAHDVCYGTCNSDKEKCDIEFRRCLYKVCLPLDEKDVASCKMSAKVMYSATATLGCKYYQMGQSEACYCPPPKKKKFAADEL